MDWQAHNKNREQFPPEKLAPYYGRQVAWSLDGTQIVASGEDDGQVYEAAKAAGYSCDQVVVTYVPFPDEIFLGSIFSGRLEEAD